MLDLALHAQTGPVSLADISERQGISLSYLEQLFAKLRRSNLVSSVRGPGGGYQLSRDMQGIQVAQVIDAVNESVDATKCQGLGDCHAGDTCLTHHLWCSATRRRAATPGAGSAEKRRREGAREQVAALIGADPREIVWTSGATESNNLALKGAAHFYKGKGKHLITVKTEHKAVLDTMRELERQGFEVTYLDVQEDGLLDLDAFKAAMRPDTILVSR
jgi:Rrf2 family protein